MDNIEDTTYQLRILSQKIPGVLVQLTEALESLEDVEVLSSYHTSFQDRMLSTFILQVCILHLNYCVVVLNRFVIIHVAQEHSMSRPVAVRYHLFLIPLGYI